MAGRKLNSKPRKRKVEVKKDPDDPTKLRSKKRGMPRVESESSTEAQNGVVPGVSRGAPLAGVPGQFIVPEDRMWLLDQYVTEKGLLTDAGKKLMTTHNQKGKGHTAIRDEIVMWYWTTYRNHDDCWKRMQHITGLSKRALETIIQKHSVDLMKTGGAQFLIEEELALEKFRYETRKGLISVLQDTAVRALKVLNSKLVGADARQAAGIAAICIDKSLLLAGQATTRVARSDERFMDDEALAAKRIEATAELTVIEGDLNKIADAKESGEKL